MQTLIKEVSSSLYIGYRFKDFFIVEIEQSLLKLCSNAFFSDSVISVDELPKADALDKIFEYAAAHGVLPLIMNQLEGLSLPDVNQRAVVVKWYGVVVETEIAYRLRLNIMEQLSATFKREGLSVMFLKGATLAQMYPRPELRMFSDVDFYLYGQCEAGVQALERIGIKTSDWVHHHMQSVVNGVLIENHYDFIDRRNHSCNYVLDDELKALAESEGYNYPFHFENTEIDNAYCLSPTMNAIFLMRHMSAHFVGETISLRMLFDWILFLINFSKEVDWIKVIDLYERSGMIAFAQMIQYIISDKLGMQIEGCKIDPLGGSITDKIWRSILVIPDRNTYRKGSVKYLLFESKVFWNNRWKHRIVFPNESYMMLFLKLVTGNLKQKIV